MQIIRSNKFLRGVLFVDATTGMTTGFLLTLFATKLSEILALPVSFLFYAGLVSFPFAAFFLYVATRKQVAAFLVWVIIIGNLLWALDSFLLLLMGWFSPNTFGVAFIVTQAIGVAILADLEFIGLKRSQVLFQETLQHS